MDTLPKAQYDTNNPFNKRFEFCKKFIKVEPVLSAQVKVVRILNFIRVCKFFCIIRFIERSIVRKGLLNKMLLEKVY